MQSFLFLTYSGKALRVLANNISEAWAKYDLSGLARMECERVSSV